jgi:S1-C subfamily serine protease
MPPIDGQRYRLGTYLAIVNVWQPVDGGYWGWGQGLHVTSVEPNSAAWGRLDPGDIIVRVNGTRVYDYDDVVSMLQTASRYGGVVRLTLRNIRTGYFEDHDICLQYY